MKSMNRFIRLHPVRATVIGVSTSLLLIILCIYGGMKINKHIYPNDIYYTEEGLIYNDIQYEYLDEQKWELLKVPEYSLGKFYSDKYSLIPLGEFCSFSNDPEKVFIKDVGQFLQFSYVREDKKPNVYDSSQIGKIVLESINESIELTESKTISECLDYLKDVKDKKHAQSDKAPGWDKKFDLYLYLKEYPVRYQIGQIYMNNSDDIWMFDSNRGSAPMNYEIPKELKEQMKSEIKK